MNITRSISVTTRPYLTAGIAAVCVGAIALAPVQAVPDQAAVVPPRVVSDVGAMLAASFDPITPWVDTITTSIDNVAALIGFAFEKPFPILQTLIGNLGTYLGEIASGNFGLIFEQVADNIGKLFTSPFDPGRTFPVTTPDGDVGMAVGDYLSNFKFDNNIEPPRGLTQGILFVMGVQASEPECQEDGACQVTQVAPIVNFLNSHASGALLGLLGPVLSPVAALVNSASAIVAAITDGDFIGAINEIVNVPANLVNGLLNGAPLDLIPILGSLLEPLGVAKLVVQLGGLISGPVPLNGGELINPETGKPVDPPTRFSGGMGLDALTGRIQEGTGGFDFAGFPVGPIGSLIGMGQFLGQQLVVTPPVEAPAAQTAAAVEVAPVEVSAPSEVAVVDAPVAVAETTPAVAVAEVAETAPAKPDVAKVAPVSVPAASVDPAPQVQASADATDTPTRAGARASRTASADTGAGTPKRSSRR